MGAFKVVKLVDPIFVATNGVAFAHTGSTATSGTFKLYEGNNITFTTAGNSLTIHGGAGVGGGIGIAAGTRTATTANTLLFDNANGVTFGLNAVGGSIMTASHNALTTAMQSQSSSVFAKTGFTTTSVAGAVVAGTHDTDGLKLAVPAYLTTAQPVGAYLTTARASTDAIGLNTALTANGVSVTANSSGLSLNFPAFLTTAMQSNAATLSNIRVSGGTTSNLLSALTFNDANGVSFGLNGSIMTASVAAVGGAQTGISGIGASDTTFTSGTVIHSAQANITIGTSVNGASQYLQYSVAAPGAGGGIGIAAGTRTATTANTLLFETGNGITFGLNAVGGSVMTASHNAITTGRASNDAVGLNTALTAGPLAWTVNSAGISLNAGSAAGTTSGFTGGASISGSMTHNTAGLALSLSHPAWLTTAMLSNAATISAINVSAGTTSSNQSSIGFSNANGLSFGFSGASITGSHNAITTARASTDAIGLNSALTANGVSMTANSSGLSLNFPAFLTTAMQSGSQSQLWIMGNSSATIGGTNISGTVYSNGMSLSAAAPGAGAAVTVSASNGSFTVGNLNFSNANNVTFGTSAGSIITASVAAPGAAAENNWVNLLGANTAGNTTASGSTIGYSGINLTLSGTNNSVVNISAPATSSLSASGGLSISTNGSTISIGNVPAYYFEPVPMLQSGSTTYLPGIGTWHFQPMYLPLPIGSGRINGLYSFGSTSNLLAASNGTSFQTGTTGGASYSFALSKSFAFYSLGAGSNSTRLESFYNATWSMGASHSMGVSITNASQVTGQRQASIAFIASIGSDGGTTAGGLGGTHAASFANSSTATSAYTSGLSSIYNYLSGAMLIPIPLVTTLNPGMYWVAEAYSTAVTTAGSTNQPASIWPMVNQVAFYGMASMSHRQFGKTASSTGSQYMPGKGIFSVVSAAPPTTVAFSDIRSLASHQFNYFNIIRSGASV
jgi:hypothetical protein